MLKLNRRVTNLKINCKDKAELIKYQIKQKIDDNRKALLGRPTFAIIQVGDNEASNRYVNGKLKDCAFVGIETKLIKLPEETTTEQICKTIESEKDLFDAIMVQFPLPDHINKETVLAAIPPEKDVDGLVKNSLFTPCTPLGVMCILQEILGLDLTGKNVLLLGRSELVGMPLFHLLQKENATVTLCHSKTTRSDLDLFSENAEIIISAVGKRGVISTGYISAGTIVIDVGINFDDNGKLCGDISEAPHYYKTPVPGGVGLMTRAMLLKNILKAYEMSHQK